MSTTVVDRSADPNAAHSGKGAAVDTADAATGPRAQTRVAVLLRNFSGGGAERMMLNLAEAFAGRGFAVDLVVMSDTGHYRDALPAGVRVVHLNAKRTMLSPWPLARYLRRERPAAMLSTLANVNIVAVLARYLARVPVRIVVREAINASTQANELAKTLSPFMRLTNRMQPWLYRLADGIVAVSEGVARDLVEQVGLPAAKVQVINNPVLTPHHTALAAAALDHPWFVDGAPPVILGVGRLAQQKDFATLIRAFAAVRRDRPVRLLILGEGPLQEELGALAASLGVADDVGLPGFAANPYAFMARAALLVLSSRWEGSPNVLVEALGCGTPVVATDCPSGPREILENGRFGPLVAVGDADGLAAAIRATLTKPLDDATLRGRAAAFSAADSATRYLDLLLGPDATGAAAGHARTAMGNAGS